MMNLSEWAVVIPTIFLAFSAEEKFARLAFWRRSRPLRAAAFAASILASFALTRADLFVPTQTLRHHVLLFALVFSCVFGSLGFGFLWIDFIDKKRMTVHQESSGVRGASARKK